MLKIVLDTSLLIQHWRQSRAGTLAGTSRGDVEGWARRLIQLQDSDAIVTPVAIEFLCGVLDRAEMDLSHSYLERFRIIDGGNITVGDWESARRLAERIPPEPRPRGLVDCLIRAIASRHRYEVRTLDQSMPRMKSVKRKRH